MATLLGSVMTSHVPAIGGAIANKRHEEPYWKPFFAGYPAVHQWLGEQKPDTLVVISNDHGLNFFMDKMPTFAVGAAAEYRNADEGWGIPQLPALPGDLDLSWHLIESLVADEFDIVTCQEMVIDHGISLPMALLWPDQNWPVRIVPIIVNTVQSPLPSATRCWKFGEAIGRAIASWPAQQRVLVVGTGGLSHQLDGERAGHINKAFDLGFMDSLTADPQMATRYSNHELVELTGTQGIELLMWLTARATMPGAVRERHRNYHVPISNTATGLLVLEHTA